VTNGRLDLGAFQVQTNAPPPPPTQATTTTILPVPFGYVYVNGLVSVLETVTAQVTAANGQPVNQGTVTFNDGGVLAAVPVQGGRATYIFSFNTDPGNHSITAKYTGPSQFGDSSAIRVGVSPDVPPLVLAQLDFQTCIADFFQAIVNDI
jgi:hypothetical protein